MPTLADLLDVKIERPISGRSLLPLMKGDDAKDRIATAGNMLHGPERIGLRTRDYKYIVVAGPDRGNFPLVPPPAQCQLYDLKADPGEHNNLADLKPNVAEEMSGLLNKESDKLSRQVKSKVSKETDPATFERLKSLGYVQ